YANEAKIEIVSIAKELMDRADDSAWITRDSLVERLRACDAVIVADTHSVPEIGCAVARLLDEVERGQDPRRTCIVLELLDKVSAEMLNRLSDVDRSAVDTILTKQIPYPIRGYSELVREVRQRGGRVFGLAKEKSHATIPPSV